MRLATIVGIGLVGFAAPWLIIGAQYDSKGSTQGEGLTREAALAEEAGRRQLSLPNQSLSPFLDQQLEEQVSQRVNHQLDQPLTPAVGLNPAARTEVNAH